MVRLGPTATHGELVAGYRAIRARGRAHGAKEKKLLRRDGPSLVAIETGHNAPASWLVSGQPRSRLGWPRSDVPDRNSTIALTLKPTRREAWRRNLSGPCRQRGERPHASGNVRPASFGADKLMRAHAIVATMIAPAIAMV